MENRALTAVTSESDRTRARRAVLCEALGSSNRVPPTRRRRWPTSSSPATTASSAARRGAALRGDVDKVRGLLSLGTCANAAAPDGTLPLGAACRGGHVEVLRELLVADVELDAMDDASGLTALHWACAFGHAACASLLLEAGCAIDVHVHPGETALYAAAESGEDACVALLLARRADATPRRRGAERRSPSPAAAATPAVRLLLNGGAAAAALAAAAAWRSAVCALVRDAADADKAKRRR